MKTIGPILFALLAWPNFATAEPRLVPRAAVSCPAAPAAGCDSAPKGSIRIRNTGDPVRNQLLWKWTKGTAAKADFGTPTDATSYRVCVYVDGELAAAPLVDNDGNWRELRKGFKYRLADGNAVGITKVRLTEGSGRAKLIVKGRGPYLSVPVLPLAPWDSVTAQLVKDSASGAECWESVFAAPFRDGASVFKADDLAASTPVTVSAFTSLAGSAGLISPPSAATLVDEVATGQAVPLASGGMRLYFEAPGADGRTRILSIDSADDHVGLDFNAGAASTCSTTADYSPGGGCEPAVEIGVDGDAVGGHPQIANARQFKVGVPTLADWRWDEAAGTFMVFTVDAITGCTTASHNQAYAVWDGSAWNVEYETGGCPKLMQSVQAATPLHLGGTRFKLYFGDPSISTGRVPGSPLPFLGPKKLAYADGAASGDPDRIDFEDWETPAQAHGLDFVWPDGTPLDAGAEGYIDDFVALSPTADLDFQVLYVALTDGATPPFTAIAVLLNP